MYLHQLEEKAIKELVKLHKSEMIIKIAVHKLVKLSNEIGLKMHFLKITFNIYHAFIFENDSSKYYHTFIYLFFFKFDAICFNVP